MPEQNKVGSFNIMGLIQLLQQLLTLFKPAPAPAPTGGSSEHVFAAAEGCDGEEAAIHHSAAALFQLLHSYKQEHGDSGDGGNG
jgi:hypothetical protein